jgi:hypothetical protein
LHQREWCLEGMNLVQISKEITLAVGVCFLPFGKPGSRQRVLMMAAKSPLGPYSEIGAIFDPFDYHKKGCGENGHPDVLDRGDKVQIVFQARHGNNRPWHLREIEIEKSTLCDLAETCFESSKAITTIKKPLPFLQVGTFLRGPS